MLRMKGQLKGERSQPKYEPATIKGYDCFPAGRIIPLWKSSGTDRKIKQAIKEMSDKLGILFGSNELYYKFGGFVTEIPSKCLICPHRLMCVFVAIYIVGLT